MREEPRISGDLRSSRSLWAMDWIFGLGCGEWRSARNPWVFIALAVGNGGRVPARWTLGRGPVIGIETKLISGFHFKGDGEGNSMRWVKL